jgi:O-antigen ligase
MNLVRKYFLDFQFAIYLLAIFIVLPLINFKSTIDQELAPRFFITSLLLLLYSLYLFLSAGKVVQFNSEGFRIFVLTGLMLLWMLLCIIPSLNKGDAFLEWFRLAEVYCFLMASLFVFSSVLNPIKFLSRASILALLIFAAYGIGQFISVLPDLFKGNNIHINEVVTSSLANKNFFSEVLVLLLPFLIYGAGSEKGFWKSLFIISIVIDFVFIGFLQSMSSWAALIISTSFFLFSAGKRKIIDFSSLLFIKKNKIITTVFFLAFATGFYFYIGTSGGKRFVSKIELGIEYLSNPSTLTESRPENNNSVFERLLLWRNTSRMIADHPLIGVGINNWKLFNPPYGIGGTQFINSGLINYEHPHNDYLLILAEQGPVGLLLYLAFFAFAFFLIKKKMNSGEHSRLLLLLLRSSLIAFMILSIFGYPRSRFYSMLILMIIFAILLSLKSNEKTRTLSGKFMAIGVFIISIFSGYASYCRLIGEIHTKNMLIAQLHRNYARMVREADRASSWYFPMDLTSTPFGWYKGMAFFYSRNIPEAIEQYQNALKINPNHLRILNDLGSSYEHMGDRQRAVTYYRKALAITPQSIEVNLNLSAAYFNLRNIDSSFYFIDQIYKQRMSVSEDKSYNQFLDAILYAKAYSILSQARDTTFMRNGIPLINDKVLLRGIYTLSKDENKPFAKILENRVN